MIKLDFDERDLRSLRVFCNVAEAGGFAAAERRSWSLPPGARCDAELSAGVVRRRMVGVIGIANR